MKTLFEHETIYVDPNGTRTDALLVEAGRILAIGGEARSAATDERVVLEGACLVPGLTDAHIHLWGLGQRSLGSPIVELRGASGPEELLQRLRGAALWDGWVFGMGWDENLWGDSRLSLSQLDEAFPNVPVCLRRIDGHAFWVNSLALRLAGIDETTQIPGGECVKVGGLLTGLLVDKAMEPVSAILPTVPESEDEAVYRESVSRLRSFGITGAHKAWMPANRMGMLERLKAQGELGIRLYLFLDGMDPDLHEVFDSGPYGDVDLGVGCVKFFADGAMGSRGARLFEPYRDSGRGVWVHGPELLNERIPWLTERGWQVAVHAIGDEAASAVLDAYALVPNDVRRAARLRLEHAQMMRDADIERMRELGVVPSVQFIHMRSDAAWLEQVLSAPQLLELFRWRDLAEAGTLAGGSDFPIEDPNPWHAISCAMTRRDAKGRVFHVEHALSFKEAFASYTTGAAWARHQEKSLGKLEPGFFADFAILDRDPFSSSAEEIWEMNCLGVALGGDLDLFAS